MKYVEVATAFHELEHAVTHSEMIIEELQAEARNAVTSGFAVDASICTVFAEVRRLALDRFENGYLGDADLIFEGAAIIRDFGAKTQDYDTSWSTVWYRHRATLDALFAQANAFMQLVPQRAILAESIARDQTLGS